MTENPIPFYTHGFTMAPMAGVTDSAFRRICIQLGATCLVTEMVTAAGLSRKSVKTKSMLKFHQDEKPIGVQLFGAKPEDFAKASALVSPLGFSFIDINAGCPVKRVLRSGSGSALLGDIPRLLEIVRVTKQNTDLPVTVKIRLGLTRENPVPDNIGELVSEAGACALAVHGRFRTDFFAGEADTERMKQIAELSPLPVIANGDSTSVEAALKLRDNTGSTGLLVGRGAWGNPWIFRGLNGGNPHPEPGELHDTIMNQLLMMMEYIPSPQVFHIFRGHLVQYFRGFYGAAAIRNRAVRTESLREVDMLAAEADIAMHTAVEE
ncbi:MAG: tRNA-dihydrouridine synthase family protein [Candidatus Fermentibacteraceae bacterium]|nr:tRNA-dihydrouridine synthase family protein [Candidatus Fermentibacteraceae bacterium]